MGCIADWCASSPCGGGVDDDDNGGDGPHDNTDEGTDSFILQPNADDVTFRRKRTDPTWENASITVVNNTPDGGAVQVVGDLQANGVWLGTNFDVAPPEDQLRKTDTMNAGPVAVTRLVLNGGQVADRRRDVDIEGQIRTNDSLAVLMVDNTVGLGERYGGRTVLEAQTAVIQFAIENDRTIVEVFINNTPTDPRVAALIYDYDNLEVFQKPGAGSAAAANCVHCENMVRGENNQITQLNPVDPAETLIRYLTDNGVTDLVVMGYNALQCVGVTIFGSLTRGYDTVVNNNGPPPRFHVWKYEKGLLDFGFNVLTSRALLGSGGGPLGTAYNT